MDEAADVLVIGAGIAGASVAYFLAEHARVQVLEREDQPGYHSTGRSVALFSETYGPPQVQALSCATRGFLDRPPAGFSETPLLSPRGALMVGGPQDEDRVATELLRMRRLAPDVQRLSADAAGARVPVLRPEFCGASIFEPGACDIDVHALHQGFLRGIARRGGKVSCRAEVLGITRSAAGWTVHGRSERWTAPRLVVAAGAWADEVAVMAGIRPLGLVPCRRSAFTFAPPALAGVSDWPAVIALDESWYFKPDAGLLIGSPANADPVPPQDVVPELIDIASAIDRIQSATTLTIARPLRTWAGLRSFVADGGLVGGPDPDDPSFVWSAAQGGYGIQTCAAMGEACAALALGLPWPGALAAQCLKPSHLLPDRLRGLPAA